jgi:hypothetical protein
MRSLAADLVADGDVRDAHGGVVRLDVDLHPRRSSGLAGCEAGDVVVDAEGSPAPGGRLLPAGQPTSIERGKKKRVKLSFKVTNTCSFIKKRKIHLMA